LKSGYSTIVINNENKFIGGPHLIQWGVQKNPLGGYKKGGKDNFWV
jgi:hypothetical protein